MVLVAMIILAKLVVAIFLAFRSNGYYYLYDTWIVENGWCSEEFLWYTHHIIYPLKLLDTV